WWIRDTRATPLLRYYPRGPSIETERSDGRTGRSNKAVSAIGALSQLRSAYLRCEIRWIYSSGSVWATESAIAGSESLGIWWAPRVTYEPGTRRRERLSGIARAAGEDRRCERNSPPIADSEFSFDPKRERDAR